MTDRVELNGELVAADQAQISVFDAGLLYGAGLFETLRVVRGIPIDLERHISRLHASADHFGWRVPEPALLSERVKRWCDASGLELGQVRLTVTLGSVAGHSKFSPHDPVTIVFGGPLPEATAEQRRLGLAAISLPLQPGREAGHKSLSYLSWWQARVEALERGADDAILVTTDERVLESTTGNVFALHDGRWRAPWCEAVLPGVTRRRVIELLRASGQPVDEGTLLLAELRDSEEVLLTQPTAGVLPLVRLDAAPIGSGRPGPATEAVATAYEAWAESWAREGGDSGVARRLG